MFDKRRILKSVAALAAAAVLAAPLHAQQLEEVTYLLPAPAFLPAFGPWMLAQARGYYAKEGLKVSFAAAQGGGGAGQQGGAGAQPRGGGGRRGAAPKRTAGGPRAGGPAGVWQVFAARKADAMAAVPDWIASARE